MTTSLASSILAEPKGDDAISHKSLAYASEAARTQLYDLVLRVCDEAGVTNATLAKRLGKDPAQISRLLGASGNWTIDTAAQLLFGANGSLLEASCFLPLKQHPSNDREAQCFKDEEDVGQIGVVIVTTAKRDVVAQRKFSTPGTFKW